MDEMELRGFGTFRRTEDGIVLEPLQALLERGLCRECYASGPGESIEFAIAQALQTEKEKCTDSDKIVSNVDKLVFLDEIGSTNYTIKSE